MNRVYFVEHPSYSTISKSQANIDFITKECHQFRICKAK